MDYQIKKDLSARVFYPAPSADEPIEYHDHPVPARRVYIKSQFLLENDMSYLASILKDYLSYTPTTLRIPWKAEVDFAKKVVKFTFFVSWTTESTSPSPDERGERTTEYHYSQDVFSAEVQIREEDYDLIDEYRIRAEQAVAAERQRQEAVATYEQQQRRLETAKSKFARFYEEAQHVRYNNQLLHFQTGGGILFDLDADYGNKADIIVDRYNLIEFARVYGKNSKDACFKRSATALSTAPWEEISEAEFKKARQIHLGVGWATWSLYNSRPETYVVKYPTEIEGIYVYNEELEEFTFHPIDWDGVTVWSSKSGKNESWKPK